MASLSKRTKPLSIAYFVQPHVKRPNYLDHAMHVFNFYYSPFVANTYRSRLVMLNSKI